MEAQDLAQNLVNTLPKGSSSLFNPYTDVSEDDNQSVNTPQARTQRLAEHLNCRPRHVLVGEAPGYQGCRITGVAFTSERLLKAGKIPRLSMPEGGLSTRARPWSEPSATIVWETLWGLEIADSTVLWNALQMHPRKPENAFSNRKPSNEELQWGTAALKMLASAYPHATFVPIGRSAELALQAAGISAQPYIRHPAFGGKRDFVEGLRAIVRRGARTNASDITFKQT